MNLTLMETELDKAHNLLKRGLLKKNSISWNRYVAFWVDCKKTT